MISDFTTNLLKDFICRYTESFAIAHIDPSLRRKIPVNKAIFNYETESWERRTYDLPWGRDDFVLLTPKDMLTRDENWINRTDMIRDFESIPVAIPDAELRGQVFNYFQNMLGKPRRPPTQKDKDEAAIRTIMTFPQLVDYYIKMKEASGDEARDISSEKVIETIQVFETQVKELQWNLAEHTSFYKIGKTTYDEAHQRLAYLKDVIENKGGQDKFEGEYRLDHQRVFEAFKPFPGLVDLSLQGLLMLIREVGGHPLGLLGLKVIQAGFGMGAKLDTGSLEKRAVLHQEVNNACYLLLAEGFTLDFTFGI